MAEVFVREFDKLAERVRGLEKENKVLYEEIRITNQRLAAVETAHRGPSLEGEPGPAPAATQRKRKK